MIIELALAFTLHGGAQEHPRGDRWFGADKVRHFLLSAFVQSVSFSALRTTRLDRRSSFVGASVVSIGAGIGKEIADRRGGGVLSARDLVWDAAGIGAATALLRRTK